MATFWYSMTPGVRKTESVKTMAGVRKVLVGLSFGIAVLSVAANIALYNKYSGRRVIVTVGTEAISRGDYRQALEAQYGQAVLTKLVYEKLVLQAAARARVSPSAKDVDTRLGALLAPPPAGGGAEPDPRHVAELRRGVMADAALENLRLQGVGVTDREVSAYYARHRADFLVPPQVETLMVVAKDRVDAGTAASLLRQDVDPGVIAQQPSLRVVGEHGYLFDFHALPRAEADGVARAALGLRVGEVRVIATRNGFLILKGGKRRAQGLLPLAQVKGAVERAVRLAKAPSEAAELALSFRAAKPDFDEPRYAAFFQTDPARPSVSRAPGRPARVEPGETANATRQKAGP